MLITFDANRTQSRVCFVAEIGSELAFNDAALVESSTALEVNCTLLDAYPGEASAHDLYFWFHGETYRGPPHVTVLGPRTAGLRLPNMTRSLSELNVTCYVSDEPDPIAVREVIVAGESSSFLSPPSCQCHSDVLLSHLSPTLNTCQQIACHLTGHLIARTNQPPYRILRLRRQTTFFIFTFSGVDLSSSNGVSLPPKTSPCSPWTSSGSNDTGSVRTKDFSTHTTQQCEVRVLLQSLQCASICRGTAATLTPLHLPPFPHQHTHARACPGSALREFSAVTFQKCLFVVSSFVVKMRACQVQKWNHDMLLLFPSQKCGPRTRSLACRL